MAIELAALTVAAEPDAWRELGFAVDEDGTCRIGEVRVHLTGEGRHIRTWTLRGLQSSVADVDGLITSVTDDGLAQPASHPNGTVEIDHLVVSTPALDRTVEALAAIGLEPRRYRTAAYDTQQAFFRLGGPVILEVIGPRVARGEGPARFFGIAVTARDLDATAAHLGDRLHRAKDAVQPGRRIATLDKGAGAGTAVAFMSPGRHSVDLIESGQG